MSQALKILPMKHFKAPFQCIAHIPDPGLREGGLCSRPGWIPQRGRFVGLSVCRFPTVRRQTDKNHPTDRAWFLSFRTRLMYPDW
jgi:hypothetical protein